MLIKERVAPGQELADQLTRDTLSTRPVASTQQLDAPVHCGQCGLRRRALLVHSPGRRD